MHEELMDHCHPHLGTKCTLLISVQVQFTLYIISIFVFSQIVEFVPFVFFSILIFLCQ